MNWLNIKDTFLKYWFIGSAILLAILYILLDRKSRQLSKAISDAQTALIAQKLEAISEQSKGSQEDYEKAKNEYEALKRRHGDIVERLRLSAIKKQ